MTEFVVFLLLFGGFAGLLWLLLRQKPGPKSEQAGRATKIRERADVEPSAKAHATSEDALVQQQTVMPFGEDITNPNSRTIPEVFWGSWGREGRVTETIEATRIVCGSDVEEVVAVRLIERPIKIAIVTLRSDGAYALHYRGLSPDGTKCIDLESQDRVLEKCRS